MKQDIQQRGVPSAMITDVRPTTEVAANKVHYKLTPQVIHQIFVEYPRVLDVYEKYVPDRVGCFGLCCIRRGNVHACLMQRSSFSPLIDDRRRVLGEILPIAYVSTRSSEVQAAASSRLKRYF